MNIPDMKQEQSRNTESVEFVFVAADDSKHKNITSTW